MYAFSLESLQNLLQLLYLIFDLTSSALFIPLFGGNVSLFILGVPVFGSMIGVLIAFIFYSDLEHRYPIF